MSSLLYSQHICQKSAQVVFRGPCEAMYLRMAVLGIVICKRERERQPVTHPHHASVRTAVQLTHLNEARVYVIAISAHNFHSSVVI